jgi:hypothetical protein
LVTVLLWEYVLVANCREYICDIIYLFLFIYLFITFQHKMYSTYAELSGESTPVGTDSYEVSDDDDEDDEEDDEDREDGYYVPNTSGMVHDDQPAGYVAAPYSPSLRGRLNPENNNNNDDADDADSNAYTKDQAYTKAEPSSETTADSDMEWTVLEPSQQQQQQQQKLEEQPGGYDDPEVYRILARVDGERVKAAVRNYAETLGSQEGEALLRHILAHVKAIELAGADTVAGSGADSAQKKVSVAVRPKISIGGGGVYAGAHALPELAKLPLSYGSKVFNAPAPAQSKAQPQPQPQYVPLSGQGGKCVSSNPLTRPGGAKLRGSGECPVARQGQPHVAGGAGGGEEHQVERELPGPARGRAPEHAAARGQEAAAAGQRLRLHVPDLHQGHRQRAQHAQRPQDHQARDRHRRPRRRREVCRSRYSAFI